ncbi:pyocin knob domain-containing protein [Paenibacillus sp. OVF10]|nr:pyocin knob domain-containing protein [Paenibacillus sp. OVF10]
MLDVDDYNSLVTYSDNGFIKKSVIIPASANLNNYIEEGRFYCPANVTVQTLLNCPVSDAFYLDIGRHAGVVQTLTTFEPDNLKVYKRNYYNGYWGAWVKVPSRQEFDAIQKHKLTQDNGKNFVFEGDLNNLVTNGQYNGHGLVNAPQSEIAGTWWYIEVQCHTNDIGYVLQRATKLNNGVPSFFKEPRRTEHGCHGRLTFFNLALMLKMVSWVPLTPRVEVHPHPIHGQR